MSRPLLVRSLLSESAYTAWARRSCPQPPSSSSFAQSHARRCGAHARLNASPPRCGACRRETCKPPSHYRTRIANDWPLCFVCHRVWRRRLSRAPTRHFRRSTPSCLTSRGSRTPMFSPTWIGPCSFTWLLQHDTPCCNAVQRGFALTRVGPCPSVACLSIRCERKRALPVPSGMALFACLSVPQWIMVPECAG